MAYPGLNTSAPNLVKVYEAMGDLANETLSSRQGLVGIDSVGRKVTVDNRPKGLLSGMLSYWGGASEPEYSSEQDRLSKKVKIWVAHLKAFPSISERTIEKLNDLEKQVASGITDEAFEQTVREFKETSEARILRGLKYLSEDVKKLGTTFDSGIQQTLDAFTSSLSSAYTQFISENNLPDESSSKKMFYTRHEGLIREFIFNKFQPGKKSILKELLLEAVGRYSSAETEKFFKDKMELFHAIANCPGLEQGVRSEYESRLSLMKPGGVGVEEGLQSIRQEIRGLSQQAHRPEAASFAVTPGYSNNDFKRDETFYLRLKTSTLALTEENLRQQFQTLVDVTEYIDKHNPRNLPSKNIPIEAAFTKFYEWAISRERSYSRELVDQINSHINKWQQKIGKSGIQQLPYPDQPVQTASPKVALAKKVMPSHKPSLQAEQQLSQQVYGRAQVVTIDPSNLPQPTSRFLQKREHKVVGANPSMYSPHYPLPANNQWPPAATADTYTAMGRQNDYQGQQQAQYNQPYAGNQYGARGYPVSPVPNNYPAVDIQPHGFYWEDNPVIPVRRNSDPTSDISLTKQSSLELHATGIDVSTAPAFDLSKIQQARSGQQPTLELDQFLICHKCNIRFREGQLPEYRHHIDACQQEPQQQQTQFEAQPQQTQFDEDTRHTGSYASENINKEIAVTADRVRSGRANQMDSQYLPFDPYLTCHKCKLQFKEGQLPEYRHHIDECRM